MAKSKTARRGASKKGGSKKESGRARSTVKVLEQSEGWDGLDRMEWVALKSDGDTVKGVVVGDPIRRREYSERFENERTRVFFQMLVGDPAKEEPVLMILGLSITSGGALGRLLEGGKLAGKALVSVTRRGRGLQTTYDSKVVRRLNASDIKKVKVVKTIDLSAYLARAQGTED